MLGQLYAESPTGGETEAEVLSRAIARHPGERAGRRASPDRGAARRARRARRSPGRSRRAPSATISALWPFRRRRSARIIRTWRSRSSACRRSLERRAIFASRCTCCSAPTKPVSAISAHNLPLGSERQKLGLLEAVRAGHGPRGVAACPDARPIPRRSSSPSRRSSGARGARSTPPSTTSALCASAPARRIGSCSIGSSAARSQLAALTLRGPGADDTDAYRSRLRRSSRMRSIGSRPKSAPAAPSSAPSPFPSRCRRSARRFPSDAALVEFAWYRPTAETGKAPVPPRYAAYLLAHGGEPQWVDLGEAAAIDGALAEWRRALRDPRACRTRVISAAPWMRGSWQPVRARLGPLRHVLISPDGELNLVPFAALVDEQGNYLVERFTDHLPDQRPRSPASPGAARESEPAGDRGGARIR